MTVKKYHAIIILVFLVFIFRSRLAAQELGLQISAGLMNYGGDLQQKSYSLNLVHPAVAVNLAYQVNHIVLRGGFTYGKVSADDVQNSLYKDRNLNFTSNISEINLCLQYDFLLTNETRKFTPYVFAGVGFFHFNPFTHKGDTKIYLQPLGTEGEGLAIYPTRKFYSLTQINNPIGVGFKYKLSSRVLIGLEFNSRLLYTDYLDDVSKDYPDQAELFKARGQLAVDLSFRGNELDATLPYPSGKIRGNPHQNDNYYTSTFSFIYIFPEHSFFGSGGIHFGSGRNGKSLLCPKKVH